MKDKPKNKRWEKETMIGVEKETRDKLKMKALKRKASLKDLLKEFANQK